MFHRSTDSNGGFPIIRRKNLFSYHPLLLACFTLGCTTTTQSTYHRHPPSHHGVPSQLHKSHSLPTSVATSSISRSSAQCRSSGGFCEPMFSCLINKGFVAGSCGGFLNVCCSSVPTGPSGSGGGPSITSSVETLPQTVVSTSSPSSTGEGAFSVVGGGSSSSVSSGAQPKLLQQKSPRNGWFNLRDNNVVLDSSSQSSIDYGPVVNDPQCGRPLSANRRVLDGQPAGFGSFPWQALIRVGKGKCGGVLVNRRHVVTAGHCIKNKNLGSVVVTLGEYHLKSKSEPLPTQSFSVVQAFVHPRFQFSPAADRYDVAVLRLERPVRYAPHITPICLPEAGRDPSPGTHAYVAGWGALIPDDVTGPLLPLLVPEVKRPSVLQVVNVPVVTNQRCERWHQNAGIKVTIWPEMVCAGYRQGGKDSCKGDSGGPLMVQQADGRWVLIGLVSAGFSCGKPGQPGIYHRISSTSDWISFYINGRDHTSRRRRRLLFT